MFGLSPYDESSTSPSTKTSKNRQLGVVLVALGLIAGLTAMFWFIMQSQKPGTSTENSIARDAIVSTRQLKVKPKSARMELKEKEHELKVIEALGATPLEKVDQAYDRSLYRQNRFFKKESLSGGM